MDSQSYLFETEINLRYLQAELAGIDCIVRQAVKRWQLAGQDLTDSFRGLSVTDEDARQVANLPFGANWGQTVDAPLEDDADFLSAITLAKDQADRCVEIAKNRKISLRLSDLQKNFKLSPFEYKAFLFCLAPALDLRYERLYAYLQDDITRKQATPNLIFNLLATNGLERLSAVHYFSDDSPLFSQQLLVRREDSNIPSLLGQAIQVEPAVTAWLLGHYQPHSSIKGCAALIGPEKRAVDQLLTHQIGRDIDFSKLTGGDEKKTPILAFIGPDVSGQEAAARQIAETLDRFLLQVDLSRAASVNSESPAELLRCSFRDAQLTGAIPFLTGWDTWMGKRFSAAVGENGTGQASHEQAAPDELLAECFRFDDFVILAGRDAWQVTGIERERPFFSLEFPMPAFTERHAIWRYFLGKVSSELFENRPEISALASQFVLDGGQIRDAVNSARDRALQEDRAVEIQDLFTAARVHSSSFLGGLARKIEPRYSWQDIILPDDQMTMLQEIVATVRGRSVVLEEWGVGSKLVASSGIPILFSGQPGTGKTMAAEVIANELKQDLYKIELSTVISKYIGETEKNLEAIFNEAEASNAILFFDEADAIFGKRSEVKDAHDRYANIEISYLLQRMERYNGVTILATNLRANLDEAFTRRLQFSVDFPFPDEEHRLYIWRTLFPPHVPREPDLDFGLLAQRFKLAGGNIRNILVSAAYLAASDGGQVKMSHLLHGARRELQKMGRLVNESDIVFRR